MFVDNPKIVNVVFTPLIFPMDESATAKLLFVPVDITICVPSGLPFDPNVIDALVVYTLNPVTVTGLERVVVDAVTVVAEDGRLL